jgi:hypothetical protein
LSAFEKWIRTGICLLSGNPPPYCDQLDGTNNSTSTDDDNDNDNDLGDEDDNDINLKNTSNPSQESSSYPTSPPTVPMSPTRFPTSSPTELPLLSDKPTTILSKDYLFPSLTSDAPSDASSTVIRPTLLPSGEAMPTPSPSSKPSNMASDASTFKTSSSAPSGVVTDLPSIKPIAVVEQGDMAPSSISLKPDEAIFPSAITMFELSFDQNGVRNRSIDTKIGEIDPASPDEVAIKKQTMHPSPQLNVLFEAKDWNKGVKKKSENIIKGNNAVDLFTVDKARPAPSKGDSRKKGSSGKRNIPTESPESDKSNGTGSYAASSTMRANRTLVPATYSYEVNIKPQRETATISPSINVESVTGKLGMKSKSQSSSATKNGFVLNHLFQTSAPSPLPMTAKHQTDNQMKMSKEQMNKDRNNRVT